MLDDRLGCRAVIKDERLVVTKGEKASVDATAVADTSRNALIETLISVVVFLLIERLQNATVVHLSFVFLLPFTPFLRTGSTFCMQEEF
jgi:hypothetical protein